MLEKFNIICKYQLISLIVSFYICGLGTQKYLFNMKTPERKKHKPPTQNIIIARV